MLSFIGVRSSIITAVCLLLFSCEGDVAADRVYPRLDLDKTPLMRYAFVSAIDEAPVAFVTSWNNEALKKAGIRSISMFSKGGKNPDDTLEKLVLHYSGDWTSLNYKGFKFDEMPAIWTSGSIVIPTASSPGEILFQRHYGIDKTLKTTIQGIHGGYRLLRYKSDNRFDTTWIFGTLTAPAAVVSKIGKTLFSIDLYMRKGSSTRDIVAAFRKLPFDTRSVAAAQCSVIFTESGRPREAFLLSETFSQVGKTKSWTYRPDHSITAYQEWIGTSVVKDMTWEYGTSQLPERLTVNRKTYFYHYE